MGDISWLRLKRLAESNRSGGIDRGREERSVSAILVEIRQ